MVLSRELVLVEAEVTAMLLLELVSTMRCDDDAMLLIWLRGVETLSAIIVADDANMEAVGMMDGGEEEVPMTPSCNN